MIECGFEVVNNKHCWSDNSECIVCHIRNDE